MSSNMLFCTCKGTFTTHPREEAQSLRNRVEELRKQHGLNQEAFARAIRVSRQTVSAIETGKYNPSLDLAFVISDFFGEPIESIFIHERSEDHEKK